MTLKFLWDAWRNGERIDGWRRSNVLASLLTMLLGLCRANFSYCIVSATRADDSFRPARRPRSESTSYLDIVTLERNRTLRQGHQAA